MEPKAQTNNQVIKLRAEIASIKKDTFDLNKIIFSVEQAEVKSKEDQDLSDIEKNIAALS